MGTISSFAFETTLATKSYLNFIERAKQLDFEVILLFLWLYSPELAIKRVKIRVKEGGHHIPEEVIVRRYFSGLKNLFGRYISRVNKWYLIDNSGVEFKFIAEGTPRGTVIKNKDIWFDLKQKYDGD